MPNEGRRGLVAWSLLFVIVCAAYGSVINLWWTYDDTQILEHALKHRPWQYFFFPKIWQELSWGNFTPLVTLSFDMDSALFGLHPKLFYVHHILVIWLCSGILYAVLRLWLDKALAFQGACIFVLGLPLATMSQQLMVRHYLEGLLFSLVSCLFFVKGLRLNKTWFAFCAALFYLGAMSAKEVYVPFVFLCLVLPEKDWKTRFIYSFPLISVWLVYMIWRWWMLGSLVGGSGRILELQFLPVLLSSLPQKIAIIIFGMKSRADYIIFFVIIIAPTFFLISSLRTLFLVLWMCLLAILPVLPVSESLSDRTLLVFWVMTSVLLVFSFNYLRGIKEVGPLVSILMISLTVVYIFLHNRDVWAQHLEGANRIGTEGKFYLFETKNSDLLWNPAAQPHYYEGLKWLRKNYYHSGEGAQWIYDEMYVCERPLGGKRLWSFSEKDRRMTDITHMVSDIQKGFCSKIRSDAPLSVRAEYTSPVLSWNFGPYENGQYSFILKDSSAKFGVPHTARYRVRPLQETLEFRVRYDSPSGWITYSPMLSLSPSQRHVAVTWERP